MCCDFDRILKTECNLKHFTRNCRIKNLDGFEREEADEYLWRAGLLNVKEKGISTCYIMNRCLVTFLVRKASKCSAVLMKHRCKVKGEQVITLQIAQQLKTKYVSVLPGQLFCNQCKANVLLETGSLY